MLVAKAKNDQYLLEIYAMEDCEDPRKDYDQLGVMVCWHPRYDLGDEQIDRDEDTITEYIARLQKENAVIMPLYLMDHSGLSMSTSSTSFSMADSAGWDWGQVGFIYMTRENIDKEFNDDEEKAKNYLIGEVNQYDSYLRGEVYGYVFSKIERCDKGHEHPTEEDSCWGFIGDIKQIKDNLSETAQQLFDELEDA